MKLYQVLLGGKLDQSRFGEDHEIVMAIGENEEDAKKSAKDKWTGVLENRHVDDIREISEVDGYRITITKI